MNPLESLGIKKEKNLDFSKFIFYFMKEFKFNPLDEEYVLPDGSKIIKKGLPLPLLNQLMTELSEHYEKEKREQEKSRHRKW